MRAAEPLDCAVGGRPGVESDEIEIIVYIAEPLAAANADATLRFQTQTSDPAWLR